MIPRDSSELVILSLLADGAMYGYAISKEVNSRTDGRMKLAPGVLYPLLRQLEAEGLVATEWEEVKSERAPGSADGRKRKWYKLSAKGRKRLDQRILAHRAYAALIDTFIGAPRAEERTR